MTPYQDVMLGSLREEIAFFNTEQFMIASLVTIIAIGLYVISHSPSFSGCVRIVPIAIGSGLWGVGRTDLLMHRAAKYIMTVEATQAGGLGWEAFKAGLPATHSLPLYDVMALGLWTYLLALSWTTAYRQLRGSRRIAYCTLTGAFVMSGALSIVAAAIR
jgi:hypothetical protein